MKIAGAIISMILCCTVLKAQYYYSDIISNQLTNNQYKLIKDNQLKKISAVSYEGNQPSTDFVMEQTITSGARQIVLRSASAGSGESYLISSFENGRVYKTVDSSRNAINTMLYTYDQKGNLVSTTSTNKDFDGTFSSSEDHIWLYGTDGKPLSMIKVKNKVDTTTVLFKYDEGGNVAEETWMKNKRCMYLSLRFSFCIFFPCLNRKRHLG